MSFPFPTRAAAWRTGAVVRLTLGAGLLAALAGCATSPVTQSHDLWNQGRIEESVQVLQVASDKDPGDRPLLAAYHRVRDQALAQIFVAADSALAARNLDQAQELYQRGQRIDPPSARARDGLDNVQTARRLDGEFAQARRQAEQGELAPAIAALRRIIATDANYHAARRLLQELRAREPAHEAGAPLREALAKPVSVEFREAPLRNVFEVLSHAAGLNFVFDHDVRTDNKVTIYIRNNSVEDVLKVLLSTNALDRKVLNENTLLVFPATAAKNKEYQDLVVRTFYLVNAEAKQVEALLRSLVHIKDVWVDEKINTIVVRDTPDAVRLAERVVQSIDIPDAEVMLEMSVIELSHTRALDLGIQLPTNITRGSSAPLTSNGTSSSGGSSATSVIPTSNMSSLITTITNPLLVANLAMTDNDSNLLANPRVRVRSREKAKILIGEKLPVITSTAVQNAGVASSVSYLDVGLKLEVEPQVYLNDEVGVKLQLEVNSNLGEVTVGNSTTGTTTAYQVGTRSAQTNLRLHDGETQVLAGLINDNESESWNKVPGLSDIPVLGRLFSNDNSNHEKTEIVLLVTPHILRNLGLPDGEPLAIPAGTETAVGAPPLVLGPTGAQSLALRPGDTNPRAPQGGRRAETERGIPAAAEAPAESAPAAPAAEAPAPAVAAPAPATPAGGATAPTGAAGATGTPAPAAGNNDQGPPSASTNVPAPAFKEKQ